MVVEQLYSLGHRKLAFIRGPAAFIDSGQRWTATARLDLPLDTSLIVDLNLQNAGHEGGYERPLPGLRSRSEMPIRVWFAKSIAMTLATMSS